MNEAVSTAKPIGEMPALEITAVVGGFALWLLIASFMIWFFWKVIRAQLRIPDEMAGIRTALERIADRLERDR